MAPDLRIEWDEVCRNPDDFERLVKLLLQRLYPEGEVVDGRGGDGGREFQVRTPDSLTLYEAKSFTGRITATNPKRRAQVERSLVSAAQHQPDSWRLVVPIDHSPSELDWFERLNKNFPFVDRWHGRTWLEEQLSRHEDLVRLATQNKLLEYVRQYKIEREALAGGVSDLLDRHAALMRLGDTISPDWRPVIGQLPDGTSTVELQAKNADAAEVAPITIHFTAAIPEGPDTEGLHRQLRNMIDFNSEQMEIPGRYLSNFAISSPSELGLPSSAAVPDRVVLVPLPETENLPYQSLAISEPGAAFPIATLGFHPERRTRGRAGVQLVAYDTARTVELITQVRLDRPLSFRMRAMNPEPVLPIAILPGLRLMQAMRLPNIVTLTLRHDGKTIRQTSEMAEVSTIDPLEDDVIGFIEDLAAIQEVLHQPFPLPATVRNRDITLTKQLRKLLDGGEMVWPRRSFTVTLDPSKIGEFKAQFPSGQASIRLSFENAEVYIGEEVLFLGPVYLIGQVVVDIDAIPDHPDENEEPVAVFRLADNEEFRARRGIPEEQPQTCTPRRAGRVAYAVPPPSARTEVTLEE